MDLQDLRTQTPGQLKELLKEQRDLLARLRFNNALQPIENPMRIRHIRRDIAQINTLLTEKAQAGAQ